MAVTAALVFMFALVFTLGAPVDRCITYGALGCFQAKRVAPIV